ncbi:MAG: hypothetical protein SF052_11510 [Bacteroidia bacterium]|nr:hypothetical protein [Bacteroidia bacterium]
MKFISIISLGLMLLLISGCDRLNDGVIYPLDLEDYPQVVLFDDEGDGDVEDGDKVEIVLTLLNRNDPSGEEIAGTTVPLAQDVTVTFQIVDEEGIGSLADYILDWAAYYEIDDCTTSDDEGIDLALTLDLVTGVGSVIFPKDVEEVIIELELKDDLLTDDVVNDDSRGFKIILAEVTTGSESVAVNPDLEFEYKVLDDELIFGKWALDVSDSAQFSTFTALFGLIDEEIVSLSADDVDEIEVEFKYNEVSIVIVLKEEETVEECGEVETVNLEIEVEGEYEELTGDALEGEIEFAEAIEQNDGSEIEFVYSGSFLITGNQLEISLEGEFDDNTAEGSFILTR